MDTHALTIKKIQQGLRQKEYSARELVQAYLNQIEAKDGDIGAFLAVLREGALSQAQAVDELIAEGADLGPLAGVPIAIKDNILIKGEQATAGSKILENYRATYDAGVIKKLKANHAVFIGKTNLDEFAMGSSTENSAFQKTKNPHDLTRVPGGSSGGSAAAVAADFAPAALGSDTGGSIRQPASFCGVVGLKPTYGAVSRSGLIALSSSLDQIGPFAKTCEDAALVFSAIAGKDPYDNTSRSRTNADPTRTEAEKYNHELLNPDFEKLREMTIGIPDEYFVGGIEPEVRKGIDAVISVYQQMGLAIKKISLPHTKYALSCYYIIQPAEASSNLARFDGVRYGAGKSQIANRKSLKEIYFKSKGEGFGAEPKRRIILGTFVLSSGYYDAYYKKALEVREYITDDFTNAFKEVDVILTPVAPTRAFKLGEKANDPLAMYLSDIFTIPVNLAGLPGISIPANPIKNKELRTQNEKTDSSKSSVLSSRLPIGFQLIGKPWREADILGLGRLYEENIR